MISFVFPANMAVAVPSFNDAVAQYKSGRYSQARDSFQLYTLSYPTNALCHYYLALSLQSLGQFGQAQSEYAQAMQYGDASLKSMAATGLQQTRRLGSRSSPSWSANTQPAQPTGTVQSSRGHVRRIIDFYTTWCHYCKAFEPTWEATKSRYRDIDFQRLDAEDPSNKSLVSEYHIHAYPTLVYLDSSGHVLHNASGAPEGEGFAQQIDSLNKSP